MGPDLNALTVFSIVADMRSFRAAAAHLGVTRSAVSQTIKRLESATGIALVQRTTRSVNLTEAGRALHAAIAPAISDIRAAVEATSNLRGRPRGQLRLAVSSIAEAFLAGPLLSGFTEANADIQLDITVTDEEFDIVAEGYDAGVRLGEVIEQDMIAVPVSADQRQLVVCSPAYRERWGVPLQPRDLVGHRCIGWRPAPNVAPYRWEFAEAGREFSVAVTPEITTNDMALMIKLAVAGAGITFGMAESFQSAIERGALEPILEDFCPSFTGFFLYYPNRRNLAPKLRALIDHLRAERERNRRHTAGEKHPR